MDDGDNHSVPSIPIGPTNPDSMRSNKEYDGHDNNNDEENKSERRQSRGSRFVLPKCELPPRSEFEPVEVFVAKAVYEQHYSTVAKDDSVPSNPAYKAILDAFRMKNDCDMLFKLLLALRIGGNGTTLSLLTASSKNRHYTKHPRLLHTIVKFCPFDIPRMIAQRKKLEENNPSACIDNIEDDYKISDAHLHLLIALVSSNTILLVPILNAIWTLLTDPKEFRRTSPTKNGGEKNHSIEMHPTERTDRLHATLIKILQLCPKGTMELFPIVALNAPNRFWKLPYIISYFRQCFTMSTSDNQYLPDSRRGCWKLMIDLCLSMDVEIKIEDCGAVSLDNDKIDDSPPDQSKGNERTVDSVEVGTAESEKSDDSNKSTNLPTERAVNVIADNRPTERVVNVIADNLDAIMLLLFEESQKFATKSVQNCIELYEILEYTFERSILITHKSKFVQFLLLHICGLEVQMLLQNNRKNSIINHDRFGQNMNSTETDNNFSVPPPTVFANDYFTPFLEGALYRNFAGKLIDIVLDPYRATVTRQAGACYLASFVCRAAYVCTESACEAVAALLRWAETYIESIEQTARDERYALYTADDSREQAKAHTLFYTVCQSAFYIMCFRGVEAVQYYRSIEQEINLKPSTSDNIDSTEQRRDDNVLFLKRINIGRDRWSKLCSNSLQPLRYCLESVRTEFLHLSKIFQLLDPSVLDKLVQDEERRVSGMHKFTQMKQQKQNGRTSLLGSRRRLLQQSTKIVTPSTMSSQQTTSSTTSSLERERLKGGVGGLGQGTNPLDSFFPFDPYLLRRSHVYVDPFYKHWTGSIDEDEMQVLTNADNGSVPDDGIGDLNMETNFNGEFNEQNHYDDDGNDEDDIKSENDIDDVCNDDNDDKSSHGTQERSGSSSDDESENSSIRAMSYVSQHSIVTAIPFPQATLFKGSVSNSNYENSVQFEGNSNDHRAKWFAALQRPRTDSVDNGNW